MTELVTIFNEVGVKVVRYLLQSSIQSGIYILLIAFLSLLFRKKSPAFLYTLWLTGLVKLIIPPKISFPSSEGSPIAEAAHRIMAITSIDITAITQPSRFSSNLPVIFYLWAFVVVFLTALVIIKTVRFERRLKDVLPLNRQIPDVFFDDLGKTAQQISIVTGKSIEVPLTKGFFNPVIYLPLYASKMPMSDLLAILSHEAAHIKRKDQFVRLFQIASQIIFFFHPLVWFSNNRLDLYREMACDDISINNSGNRATDYCRIILGTITMKGNLGTPCSLSSCFGNRRSHLKLRLKYLLEKKKGEPMLKLSKNQKVLIFGIMIVAVSLSFISAEGGPDSILSKRVQSATSDSIQEFYNFDVAPKAPLDLPQLLETVVYPEIPEPGSPPQHALLKLTISKSGDVEDISIFSGSADKTFYLPAISLLKETNWTPATLDGVAVPSRIAIALDPYNLYPPVSSDEPLINRATRYMEFKIPPVPVILETSDGSEDTVNVTYMCDTHPLPEGGYENITKYVEYPDDAKKNGIEGRTVVYALISISGKTKEVVVRKGSGSRILDDAALEGIKKIEWKAAMNKGKAVEVWVAIPVEFKLEGE